MTVTLITGGSRSGKSVHAEQLALAECERPFYLATAVVEDTEMAARVALHQKRRRGRWQELHTDTDLIAALKSSEGQGVRLVDCLSLWLSNLMLQGRDTEAEGKALAEYVGAAAGHIIFVTSEVGMGIVPDNALAREYRDRLGILNQQIGAVADRVELIVAGQALRIK